MSTVVETITKENLTATITYDEWATSPREWDNLGTMICEHNRYNLGDKHDLDFSECYSWEDHEKDIKEEFGKDCIMLPLYLYDHGGITMSTSSFSCRWDSGRVGTIVVSRKKVRDEFKVKRITKKLLNSVIEGLVHEVEIYDKYLTGEVYSYTIEDKDGDFIDSCGGYYDLEYIIKECEYIMDSYLSRKKVA